MWEDELLALLCENAIDIEQEKSIIKHELLSMVYNEVENVTSP
jgi:hypothetical protein